MSSINFPENYEDPKSDFIQFSSGDHMDTDTIQEGAIVEFSAFNGENEYIPMHPYGYNLNLEEAKILRDFLNDAIAEAERG